MPQPGEYILDRLEGEYAVLEGPEGTTVPCPLAQLPQGAKPGDCLQWDGAAWRIDAEGTLARQARIEARMRRLFHRD